MACARSGGCRPAEFLLRSSARSHEHQGEHGNTDPAGGPGIFRAWDAGRRHGRTRNPAAAPCSEDAGGAPDAACSSTCGRGVGRRRWRSAGRCAGSCPEETLGFIHAAFCLHELGRTAEAKTLLLARPGRAAGRGDLSLQPRLLRRGAGQHRGSAGAPARELQAGPEVPRVRPDRPGFEVCVGCFVRVRENSLTQRSRRTQRARRKGAELFPVPPLPP